MLPIGDDNEHSGIAFVTIGLIVVNALAFFLELSQPSGGALQSFIEAWGVVPREYSAGRDLPPSIPLPFWTTLLTSMFLHGGWAHLGREHAVPLDLRRQHRASHRPRCGSCSFYLVCGLAAGIAHILFNSGSGDPDRRRIGCDQRRAGRLPAAVPTNRVA